MKQSGSCQPKPLDDVAAAVTQQPVQPVQTQGSAWNAAQCWEERDYTSQSTLLLRNILSLGPFEAVEFTVLECAEVSGSASLVYSKGKARFLYSHTLKIRIEFALEGKVWGAFIVVDDLSNDQPAEDFDLSLEWVRGSPPGAQLQQAKGLVLGKAARAALRAKVVSFEGAFRAAHVPL